MRSYTMLSALVAGMVMFLPLQQLQANFTIDPSNENPLLQRWLPSSSDPFNHLGLIQLQETRNSLSTNLFPEGTYTVKKQSFTAGWTSLIIGATFEPLQVTETNLNLTYIDESPVPESLVADLEIQESKQVYGLNIGLEFSSPGGFTWNFDGTFTTNKGNNLSGFNLGFGHRFTFGNVHVIPMLKGGIGNGNFRLGKIKNQSTYIKVNDKEFYSDEVDVKLRDRYGYVGPELNVFVPVKENWGLRLTGAYKFAFSRGEKLSFKGKSGEGTTLKEKEELSEDNVFLYVNDKRIEEEAVLMDFGGFKAQISLVFNLGKAN